MGRRVYYFSLVTHFAFGDGQIFCAIRVIKSYLPLFNIRVRLSQMYKWYFDTRCCSYWQLRTGHFPTTKSLKGEPQAYVLIFWARSLSSLKQQ
jgi:hypothetical protein